MKSNKFIPHIIAVIGFLLLSYAYFLKPLSEGKKLGMGDISNHKGMVNEVGKHYRETGETALWTNSMFSGMPTYLLNTPPAPKSLNFIHKVFNLNHTRPVNFVFLYLIGFYIALIAFGVNPWLSILGAIGYAFSSYFFIIIEAGHTSKIATLGYLPPIIAGIHLAFHGKKLWGSLLMGIFLALQLISNHPQITYYTMIIAIVYGVIILVYKIKEKQITDFIFSGVLLVAFAALALGCNMGVLLPTLEYAEYSTRGKSDLELDEKNQTTGLDIDYATDWSYGIAESFTLLIPNFMGGPSGGELPENSETYRLFEKYQGKSTAKQAIKRQPTYWGEQPFTSGPVYVGAIIFFLFILGLFIIDKKYIWWLGITTIISLILSWGKHIPGITNFLLDNLPYYNKFRAVSMALVIVEFTIPLMAFLALNKLLRNELTKEKSIKALKYALGITTGIILFFILFANGLFNFEAQSDSQYLSQNGGDLIVDALRADRAMLLRNDAFRSLVFILLAATSILLIITNKIKKQYALIGLGVLVLIDMWGINQRYLNNDNFVKREKITTPFTESAASKTISDDKSLSHRTLNLSVSTFNDASTSFYHKSIGGYHAAKMGRYQELIDFHISNEIQNIFASFKTQDFNKIYEALGRNNALNMLNTKYIIYNPGAAPIQNYAALGNAWFVNNIKWVNNANEEIEALYNFEPTKEAVIDKKFHSIIGDENFIQDSAATIVLTEYAPNRLKYKSTTSTEQVAVFSEIYYPKGWQVTIDGESVEHFRANYVLRAMKVPAGNHEIEFRFEPESYNKGQKIAKLSSLILILLLFAAIGQQVYLDRKKYVKK